MKHLLLVTAFAALVLSAQSPKAPSNPPVPQSQVEDDSLRQALGEAGNSPVDFVRALEAHLQKFPNTPGGWSWNAQSSKSPPNRKTTTAS